jgi:hypothetical protein
MAPNAMRNTPAKLKAGVIRGWIGRASESALLEEAVALALALLDALGIEDAVVDECLEVDEAAVEVELWAGVGDIVALGDCAAVERIVVDASVEALAVLEVSPGKLVSVVSCLLCSCAPSMRQSLSGITHPNAAQATSREMRILPKARGTNVVFPKIGPAASHLSFEKGSCLAGQILRLSSPLDLKRRTLPSF